jgi:hypothetical protein
MTRIRIEPDLDREDLLTWGEYADAGERSSIAVIDRSR